MGHIRGAYAFAQEFVMHGRPVATHCTTADDGILSRIIEGVLRGQKMANPALMQIGLDIC